MEPIKLTMSDDEVFDLVRTSPKEKRCPFLRIDDTSTYCISELKRKEMISVERRLICDAAALQAYCLDAPNNKSCVFYQIGFDQ